MRRGLLVVLLICAVARAQEETKRWPDGEGKYNFELPAAWEVKLARPDVETMVVALDVKAPGVKKEKLRFELFELHGSKGERSQAVSDREAFRRPGETATASFRTPMPHMIVTADPASPDANAEMLVIGYAMRRRVGYSLKMFCHRDDWPKLKAPFFAALASLHSDVAEWPPLPDGFTRTVRDGYIYQRHPSVSEADEKKLHRFVRKQEKLFARELAPVPRPKENRPIIAVFSRRGDMGPIDHEAAADKSGTHFDSLQRRIYTLRLSDEQEAPLANDLAYLFCMQAFGGEPDWFYQGESEVAYQHARTGGKPTTVTKYRYDRLPWEGPRFDAVRTSRESDWEGFIKGSIGYTIFFHAGPSKYRKAYRNFLKDLRETGDWVEAERVHLLSLDQDRMAAAMKVFLEKRVRHTNTD